MLDMKIKKRKNSTTDNMYLKIKSLTWTHAIIHFGYSTQVALGIQNIYIYIFHIYAHQLDWISLGVFIFCLVAGAPLELGV